MCYICLCVYVKNISGACAKTEELDFIEYKLSMTNPKVSVAPPWHHSTHLLHLLIPRQNLPVYTFYASPPLLSSLQQLIFLLTLSSSVLKFQLFEFLLYFILFYIYHSLLNHSFHILEAMHELIHVLYIFSLLRPL